MDNETVLEIEAGRDRIEKKEYLNNKRVRRIIIPDSVKQIGDWAFAYCDSLLSVELSSGVSLGREVFKGCDNLKEISVRGRSKGTAAMLSAIRDEAPYLLKTEEAGTKEWIRKWDVRMLSLLNTPDDEGYSNQIMCGEEDYVSTDLDGYKKENAKKKIRLVFLRLLNDDELPEDVRGKIEDYVKENPFTREVILNEFGDEKEYYELFASLGCINEDNFDEILRETGASHTEMKAYFIRFMDEKRGLEKKDFFDMLSI